MLVEIPPSIAAANFIGYLKGKSPYKAFCFYYGEKLAQRLGCHEVGANDINLTPRLLKK